MKTEDLESNNMQLPTPQPYPWLMASDYNYPPAWNFYSLLENRSNATAIPDIGVEDTSVFTGCNGWLVLKHEEMRNLGTWHIDLLHIASLEKIKLPNLEAAEFKPNYTFAMTAPPTDPNFSLVLFSRTQPRAVIWRREQGNWSELRYDNKTYDTLITAHNRKHPGRTIIHPSVCNNKMYGMVRSSDSRTHLIVFDIVDDTLTATTLAQGPPNKYGRNLLENKYLVESSEHEIFWIEVLSSPWGMRELKFLDVYKLDQTTETWTAVSSIDDRVFFLNGAHSLSCSTTNSDVEGNCIHFINDNEAFTYVMETHSIHHYFPCSYKSFYGWSEPPLFVMV